jgi:hypothetical protein
MRDRRQRKTDTVGRTAVVPQRSFTYRLGLARDLSLTNGARE